MRKRSAAAIWVLGVAGLLLAARAGVAYRVPVGEYFTVDPNHTDAVEVEAHSEDESVAKVRLQSGCAGASASGAAEAPGAGRGEQVESGDRLGSGRRLPTGGADVSP